jgi:hypothetical protein
LFLRNRFYRMSTGSNTETIVAGAEFLLAQWLLRMMSFDPPEASRQGVGIDALLLQRFTVFEQIV